MRRLYKKDDNWLENRRRGIGGSDIAGVLGISKYSSPLKVWHSKVYGNSYVKPTNAIKLGNILEDGVATLFEDETGLKTRKNNYMLAHDKYDYLMANVDREVVGGGILEIKTTVAMNRSEWAANVPIDYMYQLQWYLGITGQQTGYFACLLGNKDLVLKEVTLDNDLFYEMRDRAVNFWNNFVVTKIPPFASENDKELLQSVYPAENVGEVKDLSNTAKLALLERQSAVEEIKRLEAIEKASENIVMQELENNETGLCEGFKATWKQQSRRTFDKDGLCIDYPEIYEKYAGENINRELRITEIKNK